MSCVLVTCAVGDGDVDEPYIPPDEHLQLTDPTLSNDTYVQDTLHIDDVHRQVRPHRGVWLFVVDAAQRVLLVHRSGRMVTCPNTWSLVGRAEGAGERPLKLYRWSSPVCPYGSEPRLFE